MSKWTGSWKPSLRRRARVRSGTVRYSWRSLGRRCVSAPVKPDRAPCSDAFSLSEDRTMKRLLLFAALVAWSGMAGAIVYKWVDAQGKVQYGDRPPDGVHAEVVELLGTHVARSAPARPSESAPTYKATNRDQP